MSMRFFMLILFLPGLVRSQLPADYSLTYSSFLGGNHFEQARDMTVDPEGNIIVVGGTSSPDFPVTPGAFQTQYNNTGSNTVGTWGPMMAFVTKFSPSGKLLWSTYLGGPNYDRAYAVETDLLGYIYVGGRAGDDFPTTPGAWQTDFVKGNQKNNLYGHQNGFIAKLTPDGSSLVWATYFGGDSYGFFRDIDVDENGSVFGILNAVLATPAGISANAFDPDHNGGFDMVAVKFSPDGDAVEWATFLGGSGNDHGGPAIRVGPDGSATVGGTTESADYPVSPGAFKTSLGGTSDFFVTRIAPDGQSLLWSTFLGGSDNEFSETHSLFVDGWGNAWVACGTNSKDAWTTPGAFQSMAPAGNNAYIASLDTDGHLVASTYYGGSGGDTPEGLFADSSGILYVCGSTTSADLPMSAQSLYPSLNGSSDGYITRWNPELSDLGYATYWGGAAADAARAFSVAPDGTILISGQTTSTDLPVTPDAFQAQHANPASQADVYLTLLSPLTVSSLSPVNQNLPWSIHPNPATDAIQITLPSELAARVIRLHLVNGLGHPMLSRTFPDGCPAVLSLDAGMAGQGQWMVILEGPEGIVDTRPVFFTGKP